MVVVFREEVGEMLFGSLISHVGDGGRRGLNTERIVWSESDGLLSLSMACVPFCAEGRASEIARPFRDLLEPFRDLPASLCSRVLSYINTFMGIIPRHPGGKLLYPSQLTESGGIFLQNLLYVVTVRSKPPNVLYVASFSTRGGLSSHAGQVHYSIFAIVWANSARV